MTSNMLSGKRSETGMRSTAMIALSYTITSLIKVYTFPVTLKISLLSHNKMITNIMSHSILSAFPIKPETRQECPLSALLDQHRLDPWKGIPCSGQGQLGVQGHQAETEAYRHHAECWKREICEQIQNTIFLLLNSLKRQPVFKTKTVTL